MNTILSLPLMLAEIDAEAHMARTEGFLGGIMDVLVKLTAVFEGLVFKSGLFVGGVSVGMICILLYLHAEHSRKPKP